jgi:hypothetical protein
MLDRYSQKGPISELMEKEEVKSGSFEPDSPRFQTNSAHGRSIPCSGSGVARGNPHMPRFTYLLTSIEKISPGKI